MSLADITFKKMCRNILWDGTINNDKFIRAKWEDGTPAYTKKIFGVCNRYDLRKEFPATTIRPTAIKSATEEILWIYQQKSNNINDLSTHIWDQWADINGSIGKAYGYQVGNTEVIHEFGKVPDDVKSEEYNYKCYPSFNPVTEQYPIPGTQVYGLRTIGIKLDQMDTVLYQLKHDPYSRRIMINLYNHKDLHEMALHPCAYSLTFNVSDEGGDRPVLNMLLNQRSQDILVAGNWNVTQYAILLMMIAQVSNMEAGQLVHMIADAHVYDRHLNIIEDLITREPYPAPKVSLNPDITNFYHFTKNDVIIEDYKAHEQIKNIEVAI